MDEVNTEINISPDDRSLTQSLTHSQQQLIRLIVEGASNAEIAIGLGINEGGIAAKREALYKKLGMQNDAQITRFAIRTGMIEA